MTFALISTSSAFAFLSLLEKSLLSHRPSPRQELQQQGCGAASCHQVWKKHSLYTSHFGLLLDAVWMVGDAVEP